MCTHTHSLTHSLTHTLTHTRLLTHTEVHEYAAQKMLESVQNKFCHEVAVALAGYLLGEVGVNICEKLGMGGYDQFAALHQHYHRCSSKTQAILLTTYMKLVNLYPDTKDVILDVFRKYSTSRWAANYLEFAFIQVTDVIYVDGIIWWYDGTGHNNG